MEHKRFANFQLQQSVLSKGNCQPTIFQQDTSLQNTSHGCNFFGTNQGFQNVSRIQPTLQRLGPIANFSVQQNINNVNPTDFENNPTLGGLQRCTDNIGTNAATIDNVEYNDGENNDHNDNMGEHDNDNNDDTTVYHMGNADQDYDTDQSAIGRDYPADGMDTNVANNVQIASQTNPPNDTRPANVLNPFSSGPQTTRPQTVTTLKPAPNVNHVSPQTMTHISPQTLQDAGSANANTGNSGSGSSGNIGSSFSATRLQIANFDTVLRGNNSSNNLNIRSPIPTTLFRTGNLSERGDLRQQTEGLREGNLSARTLETRAIDCNYYGASSVRTTDPTAYARTFLEGSNGVLKYIL